MWPNVKPGAAEAVWVRHAVHVAAHPEAAKCGDFVFRGLTFHSSEHAYQSERWRRVDAAVAESIRLQPTALDAKKANTKAKVVWLKKIAKTGTTPEASGALTVAEQIALMTEIVRAKFSQNLFLRAVLCSTTNRGLHEQRGRSSNMWAFDPTVPAATSVADRTDVLGVILTMVRAELAANPN